jgi:hypothetical protein
VVAPVRFSLFRTITPRGGNTPPREMSAHASSTTRLIRILASLSPLLLTGQSPLPRMEPPVPIHREKAPAPPHWITVDAREFTCWPDEWWFVVQEKAVTGAVVEGSKRREIRQTRLRIQSMPRAATGENPRDLAVLQHIGGTEVALLSPDDPRLFDLGPVSDDAEHPWPTACGLGLYDLDRAVDLNGNGRGELVVKAFATSADPAAFRLLLLEADIHGRPQFVSPTDFIGTIRFDDGILTDIRLPAGRDEVLLDAELLSMYRCRFLALLGVRGESPCENCCMLQFTLRRDSHGIFQPIYERDRQAPMLERTTGELQKILDVDPITPLSPAEEAALANAAAFYYLTGSGRQTRFQIEDGIGARAHQVRVKLLLQKLDRFFLRDQS